MNRSTATVLRYTFPILAVMAAYLVRISVERHFGPGLPTYVTFFPVIMLISVILGLGPGLVATAATAVVAYSFQLTTHGSLLINSATEAIGLVIFISTGICMSLVASYYLRLRTRLNEMVNERTASLTRVNAQLKEECDQRQQAEESLAAVREKNRYLAELLEASEQPFAVGYPDGTIGYFNGAYEKLTGYSRLELESMDWATGLTPPEWSCVERTMLAELDRSGHAVRYEKEYTRKDGSRVPVELLVHLMRDEQGTPACYYSFITDLTARKSAEKALQEANEELLSANAELHQQTQELARSNDELKRAEEERNRTREKLEMAHAMLEKQVMERTVDLQEAVRSLESEMNERLQAVEELRQKERMLSQQSRLAAMGEMISNIAHQWRQPLNTLALLVQELPVIFRSGGGTQEYLESSVRKSMDTIRQLSKTIDAFGFFVRPCESAELFQADEVVEKTLSLLQASLDALHIRTEIEITGHPLLRGCPSQFSQVLLNILNNARDAFAGGTVPDPLVVIRLYAGEGRTVVTVTDNAGGIPDQVIERVFDPYFSTKGWKQGTGIGLYMCKSIVDKDMNGSISVRNVGAGAEFRIEV